MYSKASSSLVVWGSLQWTLATMVTRGGFACQLVVRKLLAATIAGILCIPVS